MRNRSKILALVWGATLATTLGAAAFASPTERAAKPAASPTVHATVRRAVRAVPRRAHKRGAPMVVKATRRPSAGDAAVRKPKSSARAVRPHQQGVTIHAGRRVVRSPEPPPRPEAPCVRLPVTHPVLTAWPVRGDDPSAP
jgi:hypothetical protein